MGILVKLSQIEKYKAECFPLLMEQMQCCLTNQFSGFAEGAATAEPATLKAEFVGLLKGRLPDLPKESQQKRFEKVLKKLSK